ncbi:MAG: hypothetical protein ACK59A_16240 [Cyanobacteriota bacterium]|jgi:hypothetical protein
MPRGTMKEFDQLQRRQVLSLSAGLGASALLSTLAPGWSQAAEDGAVACAATSARSSGIGQDQELPPGEDLLPQPGELVIVRSVNPRCFYYPTRMIVEPGGVYQFDSVGFWKDGWIPKCGPEGWPGWILQGLNRLPGKPFFFLCGSVGETDQTAFAIGRCRQWTAPDLGLDASYKLYLFANDWPQKVFQSNNQAVAPSQGGPLRVSVFRVS